jgi:hypothetical protein
MSSLKECNDPILRTIIFKFTTTMLGYNFIFVFYEEIYSLKSVFIYVNLWLNTFFERSHMINCKFLIVIINYKTSNKEQHMSEVFFNLGSINAFYSYLNDFTGSCDAAL